MDVEVRKTNVVAEIGCNHKGDFSIARKMVEEAATYCKVDAVKFQKRHNKELLSQSQFESPHPNPRHAYGSTYGSHRNFLEFNTDQHKALKDICEMYGVLYSTSVWDLTSARQIIELQPAFIKVPSASNLNQQLLCVLCDEYGGDIHISLGMTTHDEVDRIVSFLEAKNRARDTVLYACTSGYPVDFDDVCLLDILRLKKCYGEIINAIGFSGHHLGIAVDIAATTLGAQWIERHFTLDRTWKGTDHAASLEPNSLRKLCGDIKDVHRVLKTKPNQILPIEENQRAKLKWEPQD